MKLEDSEHEWITLFCAYCGHNFRIPRPCRNRFCSVCSSVRCSKIRRRLNNLVEVQSKIPDQEIRFLTLTIKSEHNLEKQIRSLQKSFRRLRQRSSWKRKVVGGAFVVEITRPNEMWHAHIHCIIAGSYYPFKSLLNQWMQVSPGRGVYIKKIPPGLAVRYLSKYMTKPDETLSENDEYTVSFALKGVRLFQPFGTWHGFCKDLKNNHPPCKQCGSTSGFITQWDIGKPTPCFIYDRKPYVDPFVKFVDPF